MPANGRFDGHFVQGHVDEIGTITNITDHKGSWTYTINYQNKSNNITVEKGSITINGTSLTVVNAKENSFSVSIIPYTFENTVFKMLKVGDHVNLEFDIIGKYLAKMVTR